MDFIIQSLLDYPYQYHLALIVIAAIIWLFRKVSPGKALITADVLSAASIVIVTALYVLFSIEQKEGSPFSQRGWYIFFSITTTGLFPLVTITGHWFFGRGIGRIIRIIYKKLV